MKIDTIYIGCYKYDVRLAKILVASIRSWYADIPISLIKDVTYGPFDTSELEKAFDVSVFRTGSFGWGFGKLEPLLLTERRRCLILDADIIMTGPVLQDLEKYDEQFIVNVEHPPEDFVNKAYFDLSLLKTLDNDFQYPNFTFNTGQLVATSGVLKREDFDPYVSWTPPPTVKQTDIFKCGEQGILNYIVMKKGTLGALTLKLAQFMRLPDDPGLKIERENINQGEYRFVIHWCSKRGDLTLPDLQKTPRQDLLLHFEELYYRRVSFGQMKRQLRNQATYWLGLTKKFMKRLLGDRRCA